MFLVSVNQNDSLSSGNSGVESGVESQGWDWELINDNWNWHSQMKFQFEKLLEIESSEDSGFWIHRSSSKFQYGFQSRIARYQKSPWKFGDNLAGWWEKNL